jgi:hypothetical protein
MCGFVKKVIVPPVVDRHVDEDGDSVIDVTVWVDCVDGLCFDHKAIFVDHPGVTEEVLAEMKRVALECAYIMLQICHQDCRAFRDNHRDYYTRNADYAGTARFEVKPQDGDVK